jgi:hypothetical protein
MADSNYNVKPVENLQNVGSLSPVTSNRERRRKGNLKKGKHEQQASPQESDEHNPDEHSIDYCA